MESTSTQPPEQLLTNTLKKGSASAAGSGEEARRQTMLANAGHDVAPAALEATDKSWYALNLSNNNNAVEALVVKGKQGRGEAAQGKMESVKELWDCEQCASAVVAGGGDNGDRHTGDYTENVEDGVHATVADKGGGECETAGAQEQNSQNGSSPTPTCRHTLYMSTHRHSPESNGRMIVAAYALAGAAASITPPANTNSNRTSINNSTENLSYSSDNYYPDELIVLQNTISADDDDLEIDDDEAEKISLYSDDCVYAYRGDGADYELSLAMRGRSHFVDDETDFLEMDFEPDPLSEVECGSAEVASSFLMQRETCSLVAPGLGPSTSLAQRQLYNSPIENVPLQKGLQTQSMLSKNFARIALHLDQIKSEESPTPDCNRRESASLASAVEPIAESSEPLAHSLPNSLLATFGRSTQEKNEKTTSPSKVTGAKPKRLNTFSTSSSTSSKTSSKSRTSMRSSFATTGLCSSNSFDERSVSCTDFRCNLAEDVVSAPTVATANVATFNDETCLDCLEKEFLANTIGKAMDLSECPKCRKRRSFHTVYARTENLCHNSSPNQLKSTSLCYDFNVLSSDCHFPANEFLQYHRTDQRDRHLLGKLNEVVAVQRPHISTEATQQKEIEAGVVASQRSTCDNLNGSNLLKNVLTEPEITTISTLNLNEDTLVQALDKLHVTYNTDLIKSHFKSNAHGDEPHKPTKAFKSLKQFILHASKQNCNHKRLKRLITMATRGQVNVIFRKDPLITETEMMSVKVVDILHQWTLTNDLETLKLLDKRFQEANVLGKIANIIRQASCSPRRPLPDVISIPRYYASGCLTLTKKC